MIALKADCTYPAVAPCYGNVVGSLESIDSATIVVRRANGTTVAFPRERGTRLDVRGPGSCSGGKRGGCVALGFLGGAVFGAVTGFIIGHQEGCATGGGQNVGCRAFLAVALPGALVGMFVGAMVGGEHWKSAPLPVRLSLGPDGSDRFALGLSVQL